MFRKKHNLIKKAATILLAVQFLVCSAVRVSAANEDGLSLSAESAILIEADSGCVIFESNAEKRLPMASTTKIMTALIAIESGELDRTVKIPEEAVGIEGSSIYLKVGEELTMSDLLYGLLLESANDAAAAIAIEVAGGFENFSELMNRRAESLGLSDTHFTNPHGLDDENHYTSAADLAALTREAMQNADFRRIVSTHSKDIPLNGDDGVRCLINHNRLLKSYDGAVGVKTGFTKRSGRCLVSCAERCGVSLIAVTLNAPDDWNDHRKLLDYGFSEYEHVTLAVTGDITLNLPIVGGSESYVKCSNKDSLSVTLPRSSRVTTKIEADRYFPAPVTEGDALARAVFTVDGKEIASLPLFAESSVEKLEQKTSIIDRILKFLGR